MENHGGLDTKFGGWMAAGAIAGWGAIDAGDGVAIVLVPVGLALAFLLARTGWRWPAPIGVVVGAGVATVVTGLILLNENFPDCDISEGENGICLLGRCGPTCETTPENWLLAGFCLAAGGLAAIYMLGRRRRT